MGLLDSIMGMLGKSGGGKDVMSQLASMLTGKGGDGLGLSRLLEQFKGAGLGDSDVRRNRDCRDESDGHD